MENKKNIKKNNLGQELLEDSAISLLDFCKKTGIKSGLVFDKLPAVIFDATGRCIALSRAFEAMFAGSNSHAYLQLLKFPTKIIPALNNGEVITEEESITDEKNAVWLICKYIPIKEHKSSQMYVFKVLMDVTRLKKSELNFKNQLVAAENRVKELAHNLDVLMTLQSEFQRVYNALQSHLLAIDQNNILIELNPLGIISMVNLKFMLATGFRVKECIAKPIEDFIFDKNLIKAIFSQLNLGKTYEGVIKFIHKTEVNLFLRGTFYPIQDESTRKLQTILWIGIDHTHEYLHNIETEQELIVARARLNELSEMVDALNKLHIDLQKTNAKLQRFVNAIDQSSIILEINLNGFIVEANQNFLRIFGYEKHDIINQPHWLLIPQRPDALEKYNFLWEQITAGQSFRSTVERIAKDGRTLIIDAGYFPIRNSEKAGDFKILKIAHLVEKNNLSTRYNQIDGSFIIPNELIEQFPDYTKPSKVSGSAQLLANYSRHIFFTLDYQERLIYSNPAFCELLNLTRFEMNGVPIKHFFLNLLEYEKQFATHWSNILEGESKDLDLTLGNVEAGYFWVTGRIVPMLNAKKQFVKAIFSSNRQPIRL